MKVRRNDTYFRKENYQTSNLNQLGNITEATGQGVHSTNVSNEQILNVCALSPSKCYWKKKLTMQHKIKS